MILFFDRFSRNSVEMDRNIVPQLLGYLEYHNLQVALHFICFVVASAHGWGLAGIFVICCFPSLSPLCLGSLAGG